MSINQNVRNRQGKDFGITIGVILIAIALLAFVLKGNWLPQLFIPGIILCLLALIYPPILFPLAFIWLKIGWLLSKIVNPIVLAILFFLIITPYAFLLKVFGKKFLNLTIEKNKESYWGSYGQGNRGKTGFKRQF